MSTSIVSVRNNVDGTLDRIPPEVFDVIFRFCSFPDLLQLAGSSYAFRRAVLEHLEHRLRLILARFVSKVEDFRMRMRSSRSIISGSSVFLFLNPDVAESWPYPPRNLDIYTPVSEHVPMVMHLATIEQYTVIEYRVLNSDYLGRRGIRVITKLSKGDQFIDVVASATESAIFPMFFFHSTLVMNFLTADSIFCAYPSLTLGGRGLIQSRHLVGPHRTDLCPTQKPSIIKCLLRGFILEYFPYQSSHRNPEGLHQCRSSPICPHTVRNVADRGCLRMNFAIPSLLGDSFFNGWDRHWDIAWRLGGRSCSGVNGPGLAPFVDVVNGLTETFHPLWLFELDN